MKFFQLPDVKIGYRMKGQGPVVLLCHGLLSDGAFWDEVVPLLEKQYRLLIPDLRGHGTALTDKPFTLWHSADDLVALLDQEKLDQVHVIGFSMGGMVAMRLTIKYPHRVKSLGLISTSASQEPDFIIKRNLRSASIIRITGPLRIFESHTKRLMFAKSFIQNNPKRVEKVMKTIRKQNGPSLAHSITAVFCRDHLVAFLKNIKIPTMILVGDQDKTTPPKLSHQIQQEIPHSKLQTLEGVGHLAPIERPEQVANALFNFLF